MKMSKIKENFINYLLKPAIVSVVFCATALWFFYIYAAWTQLDSDMITPGDELQATSSDLLTAEKWNKLVQRISWVYTSTWGNVGIGTTSPSEKLMIQENQSDITGDWAIHIYDGNGGWTFRQATTGNTTGDLAIDRLYSSTHTEVMRIQRNTGNVGIGTTDPKGKLDVNWYFNIRSGPNYCQFTIVASACNPSEWDTVDSALHNGVKLCMRCNY